ncbi:hypothetical protein B4Q13_24870, partial [Lacticaseibacillus rhamnosus]
MPRAACALAYFMMHTRPCWEPRLAVYAQRGVQRHRLDDAEADLNGGQHGRELHLAQLRGGLVEQLPELVVVHEAQVHHDLADLAAAAAAGRASTIAGRRVAAPGGGALASAAQVFEQLLRHLFQKTRGQCCVWHVIAITAAIACAAQDQGVHGAGYPDVAETTLLFEAGGI